MLTDTSRLKSAKRPTRAYHESSLLVLGALLALALVGCGSTKTVTRTVTVPGETETVTVTTPAKALPSGEARQFGYIKSLKASDDGFLLRFDPALFLSGVTANVAAAEEQGLKCAPADCEPVANDHYVLDEGNRLVTYLVPADAQVIVLQEGVEGTPITAAELAELVNDDAKAQELFEPLQTGFWLRLDDDTVLALDQQYLP